MMENIFVNLKPHKAFRDWLRTQPFAIQLEWGWALLEWRRKTNHVTKEFFQKNYPEMILFGKTERVIK